MADSVASMLEGELLGGEFLDGEFVEGELLGGKFLKGKSLGGEFVEGEILGGKFVESELLGGEFVEGELLRDEFVEGEFLEGEFVEGKLLEGELHGGGGQTEGRGRILRCLGTDMSVKATFAADLLVLTRTDSDATNRTSGWSVALSVPESWNSVAEPLTSTISSSEMSSLSVPPERMWFSMKSRSEICSSICSRGMTMPMPDGMEKSEDVSSASSSSITISSILWSGAL